MALNWGNSVLTDESPAERLRAEGYKPYKVTHKSSRFDSPSPKKEEKKPPTTHPEYKNEMDVTRAIASGKEKGFTGGLHAEAKKHEKYLQSLEPHPFFRKAASGKKISGTLFVPGYAQKPHK